jgi:GntR family transcriptional regulator, transcriptional repressor for pyruvate dehydrogenase complex
MFQPLQRETTLANRVTKELEAMIVARRLLAGDKLPPERDLAQQFGVSRTVVREAVRALVAKSLLEVRPGSGTVIRSPSAESVAQSMTLFLRGGREAFNYVNVLEVRHVLEIEIAARAAERRTDDDLRAIEATMTAMADTGTTRAGFVASDVAFHLALAHATHNLLFVLLLDSVGDLMVRLRELAFELPEAAARALPYHQAIYQEVRAQNVEGARRAMRTHLLEAEETLGRALSLQHGGHIDEECTP